MDGENRKWVEVPASQKCFTDVHGYKSQRRFWGECLDETVSSSVSIQESDLAIYLYHNHVEKLILKNLCTHM